ncbi:hypothetical protein D3C77_258180 [compost metagenome]
MHILKEQVKILHRAKLLHDIAIVANIISVVMARRFINGAKPQYIDAQLLQVIQLGDNAFEIADPVAIAVFKADRVNLIYYTLFPPLRFHVNILPPYRGAALSSIKAV